MSDNDETNVRSMTRAEMNDYAAAHGIADAEGFANKDDLATAIEAGAEAGKPAETAGDGSDASAGGDGEAPASEEPDRTGARYRVLKAITVGSGQTYMPGEEIEVGGEDWPARRAKQLVEQKYIKAIRED